MHNKGHGDFVDEELGNDNILDGRLPHCYGMGPSALEKDLFKSMIFKDNILQDQITLITGGGTGLGKAMALCFAGLGSHLVLASRKLENLEAVAREIKALGREALCVPTDVRDPAQVQSMVDRAVERFGRIDTLINNAAGNFLARAEELSPNGWKAVVEIVLNGSYFCANAVGKQMIRQKRGHILNTVATYWDKGNPYTVHSAAAKAGVVAMAKTLAVEWAKHNIRVNCIAPGFVQTEGASSRLWAGMEGQLTQGVPLGRFAKPEEIAQAAVYLTSEAGAYITGEVLTVDGGGCLNQGEFPEELIDQLKAQIKK
ncbi:MAG: SDR family oxidoreductase [bacterium]|nr:SDR family oxidoreductase [bacterium]